MKLSPAQQQQRRRELYKLSQRELEKMYAKLSGHLVSEVRRDFLHDTRAVRSLVDLIIHAEKYG